MRPTSTSGWRRVCARQGSRRFTSSALHLGLAARAHREDPCRRRPCALPFPWEPEILQRGGIAATYVGHPLADAIPMEPHAKQREQPWGCVLTTL